MGLAAVILLLVKGYVDHSGPILSHLNLMALDLTFYFQEVVSQYVVLDEAPLAREADRLHPCVQLLLSLELLLNSLECF